MHSLVYLTNSLWSGLVAGGLAVLFTAPRQYVLPAFFCGAIGHFVRDVSIASGVSTAWSTVLASAVVVLVATILLRRHVASPVVLISGVLPLGAAVAAVNAVFELMKVSSASGEALNSAAVALASKTGKVFVLSLAIALGIELGAVIVGAFVRREVIEV